MEPDLRDGPSLHLSASCNGCRYYSKQYYCHQGDSGLYIYCTHPSHGWGILKARREVGDTSWTRREVGDTSWTTPDWCPLGSEMLAIRAQLTAHS
jgi:hypothetical protein